MESTRRFISTTFNFTHVRDLAANQGRLDVFLRLDFGNFDGRLNATGVIGLKGKGLLVDTTDLLRGKCSAKSLESVIPLDARDDDFNTFHAK